MESTRKEEKKITTQEGSETPGSARGEGAPLGPPGSLSDDSGTLRTVDSRADAVVNASGGGKEIEDGRSKKKGKKARTRAVVRRLEDEIKVLEETKKTKEEVRHEKAKECFVIEKGKEEDSMDGQMVYEDDIGRAEIARFEESFKVEKRDWCEKEKAIMTTLEAMKMKERKEIEEMKSDQMSWLLMRRMREMEVLIGLHIGKKVEQGRRMTELKYIVELVHDRGKQGGRMIVKMMEDLSKKEAEEQEREKERLELRKRMERVEMGEKRLEERGRELGKKEADLEIRKVETVKRETEIVAKEKEIVRIRKELDVKGKELGQKAKEIALKNAKIDMKEKDMERIEKEADVRGRNLDMKEKDIETRMKEIEEKERIIVTRFRDLKGKEEMMERKYKEIERRAEEVNKKERELMVEEEELKAREMGINNKIRRLQKIEEMKKKREKEEMEVKAKGKGRKEEGDPDMTKTNKEEEDKDKNQADWEIRKRGRYKEDKKLHEVMEKEIEEMRNKYGKETKYTGFRIKMWTRGRSEGREIEEVERILERSEEGIGKVKLVDSRRGRINGEVDITGIGIGDKFGKVVELGTVWIGRKLCKIRKWSENKRTSGTRRCKRCGRIIEIRNRRE